VEQQIQQLPARDVVRFAEWFNSYLASHAPATMSAEADWQETLRIHGKDQAPRIRGGSGIKTNKSEHRHGLWEALAEGV